MSVRVILCEGKTKIVYQESATTVRLVAKDDITAGDGAKHDLLPNKARYATETTSNVFRLLERHRIPVAFIEQDDDVSFRAPLCRMLPWEVVIRAEAHGSYLKRHPSIEKGYSFEPDLLCEFYLKTKDKMWKQFRLLCDDPLARFPATGHIDLCLPDIPRAIGQHFLRLRPQEVYAEPHDSVLFPAMEGFAIAAFNVLKWAWAKLGFNLVDFKVEFGIDATGRILIADVIDNDSWRLLEDDQYIDKQVYRDGGDTKTVGKNYERVAELTHEFARIA